MNMCRPASGGLQMMAPSLPRLPMCPTSSESLSVWWYRGRTEDLLYPALSCALGELNQAEQPEERVGNR